MATMAARTFFEVHLIGIDCMKDNTHHLCQHADNLAISLAIIAVHLKKIDSDYDIYHCDVTILAVHLSAIVSLQNDNDYVIYHLEVRQSLMPISLTILAVHRTFVLTAVAMP